MSDDHTAELKARYQRNQNLIAFGEEVLKIMGDAVDWDGDVAGEIADAAVNFGLAYIDAEGFFQEVVYEEKNAD